MNHRLFLLAFLSAEMLYYERGGANPSSFMLKVLISTLVAILIAGALLFVFVFWKAPLPKTAPPTPTYLDRAQCEQKTGKACGQNARLEWVPSAINLIK